MPIFLESCFKILIRFSFKAVNKTFAILLSINCKNRAWKCKMEWNTFYPSYKLKSKNVTQCELFQKYIIKSTTVKIYAKNRRLAFSKLHCDFWRCNFEFANYIVCFGKIGHIDLSPNSSTGLFMRQSKRSDLPGEMNWEPKVISNILTD